MNSGPPRWAEAFLRATLRTRDRDTVSGDLLEEFRAAAVPEMGLFRARIWYLRQVASLTDLPALGRVSSPLHWIVVVLAIQSVFLLVVPRALGVTLELSLFAPVGIALAIVGAISIQSRDEACFVVKLTVFGGLLYAIPLLGKMFLDAMTFPALGLAVAAAFFAPAMVAAWRTSLVRVGLLAVMGASFAGSLMVVATVALLARFGIVGNHPPVDLNFVLLSIASGVIVGMIGALVGKGAGALVHRLAR